MRKVISVLIAMILCMGLVMPAYAVEDGFVPSITYKPDPQIVPVTDEEGGEFIGVIMDKSGNAVEYVGDGCLLITPIAHVWDEEIEVIQEVEDLLLEVYDGLNDGTLNIPYKDAPQPLNPDDMVIRDLFDLRWICDHGHPTITRDEHMFEVTFDVGVVADAQIYASVYDEDTGTWNFIEKLVNNGDGTITCRFEQLGVVAFSMPVVDTENVDKDTPDIGSLLPWIIALALAVVAAVVVIIVIARRKKTSV